MSNSTKVSNPKSNGKAATKEVQLPTPEQIQAALEANIEKFRVKNDLIANRSKFLKTKEHLSDFIKSQGTDYDEFMDDSGKRVAFVDNERYSNSNGISISNNYLVREFAEFMINKIEIKIGELDKQIMS